MEINSFIIYLIITITVIASGYFLWGFIKREIPEISKRKLILPSSRLDEDPRIVFKQSLKIFYEQLKIIQPSYEHAIYLIDPETGAFVIQDIESNNFYDTIDTKNKVFQGIFADDQTLLIKPTDVMEDWEDMINIENTNDQYCLLGSKITYGGTPIGGLFALANDVRKFESKDQIFLKQVAQQITISLSIIDNIESLQNHNKIIEQIDSITTTTNISDNKTVIYEKIVALCKTIFNYDKLTIMIGFQDENHARIEYVDGHALDISVNEVFSLNRSIFSKAIQELVMGEDNLNITCQA